MLDTILNLQKNPLEFHKFHQPIKTVAVFKKLTDQYSTWFSCTY